MGQKGCLPQSGPPLSRHSPNVAIPGKAVQCLWDQFGMRASSYTRQTSIYAIDSFTELLIPNFFDISTSLENSCHHSVSVAR